MYRCFCYFKFELFFFFFCQHRDSVWWRYKKKKKKGLKHFSFPTWLACVSALTLIPYLICYDLLQCFSSPSCQVLDVSLLKHTWSKWSAHHRALLTIHSSESGVLEQRGTGLKNTDLLSCTLCDCKSDFCPLTISSSRAHWTCRILFFPNVYKGSIPVL